MTIVKYNGEEIELEDELEPGYRELDLLKDEKTDNLDDTMIININSLEDTQIIPLGDKNE